MHYVKMKSNKHLVYVGAYVRIYVYVRVYNNSIYTKYNDTNEKTDVDILSTKYRWQYSSKINVVN